MKCSFCGRQIAAGTGTMFVFRTGKRYSFCSKKCEKNMLKLGRKPTKIKWTSFRQAEKQKPGKKKEE